MTKLTETMTRAQPAGNATEASTAANTTQRCSRGTCLKGLHLQLHLAGLLQPHMPRAEVLMSQADELEQARPRAADPALPRLDCVLIRRQRRSKSRPRPSHLHRVWHSIRYSVLRSWQTTPTPPQRYLAHDTNKLHNPRTCFLIQLTRPVAKPFATPA